VTGWRWLLGPELYWGLLYLGFRLLAARNLPASDLGNTLLNGAVWMAALLAVPLSFLLLALPGCNRWAMYARLAFAACVGLNACVIVACEAIKYPEPGRDSGLMALWLLAVMAGALTWCLSAAASLYLLRTQAAT